MLPNQVRGNESVLRPVNNSGGFVRSQLRSATQRRGSGALSSGTKSNKTRNARGDESTALGQKVCVSSGSVLTGWQSIKSNRRRVGQQQKQRRGGGCLREAPRAKCLARSQAQGAQQRQRAGQPSIRLLLCPSGIIALLLGAPYTALCNATDIQLLLQPAAAPKGRAGKPLRMMKAAGFPLGGEPHLRPRQFGSCASSARP